MRRIETNLTKNDERMKESVEEINKSLSVRFQNQENNMSSSIRNLEKYLSDVHAQQISEFEVIKKIVAALAADKEDAAN